MPDLAMVYAELHKVLAPYASRLDTKRDEGGVLYLDTQHLQKNKKPLFFGAVEIKKSYVVFHFMPVYVTPALLDPLSPALRARMKGKSCFHFSAQDPALFAELSALVRAGWESYQAQGFVPAGGAGEP
jgi:hypothetical protein